MPPCPARLSVDERRRAILSVLPALEAVPGVRAVAAAQKLPLRGSGDNWTIRIVGRPPLNASTAFRMVTPGYFGTLGIPITRGRDFLASDREGTDRVVIINEALAAKFFPGEDPLGKVLQTFDETGERIVGIVGNTAEANLTDAPVPARYMLFQQVPIVYNQVSFVLRTESLEPSSVLLDARSAIARESSQLAVRQMTTMKNILDLALGPTGRVVTLVSLLAGLALVLGAVGVYGVISHYVVRRSREYGIRIALGQQPLLVVRQVVGRGVAPRRARKRDRRCRGHRRLAPARLTALRRAAHRPARDGRRRRRAARRGNAGRVRASPSRQPDGSRHRAAAAVRP